MKIIYNNFIPFDGYTAMNLFGVLFSRVKNLSKRTINHEAIHTEQIKEMFVVGLIIIASLILFCNISFWWLLLSPATFYIFYIIEWFIRLFINGSKAYRNISFEKEAYGNDDNLDYLNNRKLFAWIL